MPTKKRGGYKRYIDDQSDHRWRTQGGNGRITADSGEGYRTARACDAGAILAAIAILSALQPESLRVDLRPGTLQ